MTSEGERSCSRPGIAILLGAPLSHQNLERIGIPWLAAHFDLVILDCLPWLGRSDAGHATAHFEPVRRISSEADLKQALALHQPQYALDFIGLGPLTPCIQRVLAQAGTRFVVQKNGSLPLPSLLARLAWRARVALERKLAGRHTAAVGTHKVAGHAPRSAAATAPRSANPSLLSRLFSRIKTRASLLPPDLALLAGKESLTPFTRKSRQILWTGSQDYHLYQKALGNAGPGGNPQPFIVFVDDNLPYASDWSVLGIEPPVTPDIYYPAMKKLLDAAEAAWQMPVVVAGHPSGQFDGRVQQGFGARQLRYGQPAELVRDASLVLLHGSTAVSFAVLGAKPLVFLTTRQLRLAQYGLHVQTLARRLGQEPLNIDRQFSLSPLAGRGDFYRRYTEDFMRASQSRESSPWQAFISHVRLHTAKCPAAAPAGKMAGSPNAS